MSAFLGAHADVVLALCRYAAGGGLLPRATAPSHPAHSLSAARLVLSTLLASSLADQLLMPLASQLARDMGLRMFRNLLPQQQVLLLNELHKQGCEGLMSAAVAQVAPQDV